MAPSNPAPKWEETRKAKEDKRRELVITGQALNKHMQESQDQLDPAIFTLSQLNFLDLSGCPRLFGLPVDVERLQGLTNLVMSNNSITGIPGPALAKLSKIKVIDISSNKIDHYPEEAATMGKLISLLLFLVDHVIISMILQCTVYLHFRHSFYVEPISEPADCDAVVGEVDQPLSLGHVWKPAGEHGIHVP